MANGKIRFGKQSGGELALVIPDGVTNTEVIVPESGALATKQYVDDAIGEYGGTGTGGGSGLSIKDKTKLDEIENGATADQTAEEIKIAYESNADTNALTDALLTLLTTKKVKNITTDALNNKLVITYTDDTVSELNISSIATDVLVSGATLDATTNVLTLTNDDGGANVTVDLSDFVNSSELALALSTKEPADATILKDADIGLTVQAYDVNTTIAGNTFNGISQLVQTTAEGKLPAIDGSLLTGLSSGVTTLEGLTDTAIATPITGQVLTYNDISGVWENATSSSGVTDHTLLTNIGTNTHAQIDTALTRLENTSGSNTGDQDLSGYSLTSHNHAGVYEPADATILKDADIGSTVQGYDANTTTAGNTFNGVSQLVKLDGTGKLPAIDGSQLTNMPVALPSQTGYAGKYLKTDGTIATWESAQEALVSGTSIKTINGTSVLGGGDIITPDTITAVNDTLTSISTTEALTANQGKVLKDLVDTKQDTLVSGTSIKTINGTSVLGSGDLDTTQTDVTGNAGTATKLATARTINGVAFDGTANITVSDNTKLTATNPAITGSVTEQVYNLTGTVINPANGTIQYKTVSANTTFTETLAAGQSVLLRLIGANGKTITFPTITWVGAAAPELTANCVIVLWKEQSTLYGAYVGTLV